MSKSKKSAAEVDKILAGALGMDEDETSDPPTKPIKQNIKSKPAAADVGKILAGLDDNDYGNEISDKKDISSVLNDAFGEFSHDTDKTKIRNKSNFKQSTMDLLKDSATEILVKPITITDSKPTSADIQRILRGDEDDNNNIQNILNNAAMNLSNTNLQSIDDVLNESAMEALDSNNIDSILSEAAKDTLGPSQNEIDDILQEAAIEAILHREDLLQDQVEVEVDPIHTYNTVTASSKAFRDFRESFNARSTHAKISQEIDKAFFQSMKLQKNDMILPSSDKLRRAIMTGDNIGVTMILDGLGDVAASEVLSRDAKGRNLLSLLQTYRQYVMTNLSRQLKHMEEEKKTNITALQKISFIKKPIRNSKDFLPNKTSTSISNLTSISTSTLALKNHDKKLANRLERIERRYVNEEMRLRRQAEFRVEGRAVIHYAVSQGVSRDTLHTLLVTGRAVLHQESNANSGSTGSGGKDSRDIRRSHQTTTTTTATNTKSKKTSLASYFALNNLYDSVSGHVIAAIQKDYHIGSNMDAREEKKEAKSTSLAKRNSSTKSSMWDTLGLRISSSGMWEDRSQSHGIGTARDVVDYEVVIPWVLRNVLRRGTDIGRSLGASGVDILEELMTDKDPKSEGVLVCSEVNELLQYLGIRVTKDIVQELCEIYACDKDSLRRKSLWVRKMKYKQYSHIAPSKMKNKSNSHSSDKNKNRNKRLEHKRGNRNRNSSDSEGSEYNNNNYSDDDDYDDSYSDQKASTSSRNRQRHKTRNNYSSDDDNEDDYDDDEYYCEYIQEEMEQDQYFGLDIISFLSSLKSGKGLRTLPLSTRKTINNNNSTHPNQYKHIIDDSDLYYDQSDPTSSASPIPQSCTHSHSHSHATNTNGHYNSNSNNNNSNTNVSNRRFVSKNLKPELPQAITLNSIIKIRRKVVNCQDSFGRTPLIIAAALGHRDLVELLLQHGADITISSVDGYTAMTVATDHSTLIKLQSSLLYWLQSRKPSMIYGDQKPTTMVTASSLSTSLREEHNKLLSAAESIQWDDPQRKLLLETMMKDSLPETNGRTIDTAILSSQLQELPKNRWEYSRSALSWAVGSGGAMAMETVAHLLGTGADANGKDSLGHRPIHVCISLLAVGAPADVACAAPALLEALLSAGADVHARLMDGRTPLHCLFTAVGKYSQTMGSNSMTALHSKHRYNAELKTFSRSSSNAIFHNTSISDSHDNKLSSAPRARLLRILTRALLQWGADPMFADREGMNVLHYCVRDDDGVGCLVEMLRRGADPCVTTPFGRTTLHEACQSGATRSINVLCRWDSDSYPVSKYGDKGNDLQSIRDKNGKTANQLLPVKVGMTCFDTLWTCSREGNEARVRSLLAEMRMGQGGALWESLDDRNGNGNGSGHLPFTSSTIRASGDLDEHEELWLMHGVDAKSRRARWTPLHACIIGWAEAWASSTTSASSETAALRARRILGTKATVTAIATATATATNHKKSSVKSCSGPRARAVDGKRRTPASAGHLTILQLLLQSHAFVDGLDCKCRTPLMFASALGIEEAVAVLIHAGADLNAVDLNGNTALHYAYAYSAVGIASTLECHGADTRIENGFHLSPLDVIGKYTSADFKPLLRFVNAKKNRSSSSTNDMNDSRRIDAILANAAAAEGGAMEYDSDDNYRDDNKYRSKSKTASRRYSDDNNEDDDSVGDLMREAAEEALLLEAANDALGEYSS
eukprot:gene402-729_t